MGKELTQDLVLMRSKSDRLDAVKNLNLWGNDISGVSVLQEMVNVEVLSLSVNKITTLADFKFCSHLTELYLRKNLIADISEVKYLRGLKNLRVLWLWDNPCAESSNYRAYVINQLPQLTKLDNSAITAEERSGAPPAAPSAPSAVRDLPKPDRSTADRTPSDRATPDRVTPSYERRESPVRRVERPMTSENRKTPGAKSENILCAILALLKELDDSALELVKREIDRKISK
jgi:hypothetical protein